MKKSLSALASLALFCAPAAAQQGTFVWQQPLHTQQRLTSGTAATYNTPAGARQLVVTIIGGGGGGAGSGTGVGNGGTGGTTSFNSITAIGGTGGANTGPGAGGTGGSGTAVRTPGEPGGWLTAYALSATNYGQVGGNGGGNGGGIGGIFGAAGAAAAANSGGGGGSGGTASVVAATFYGYSLIGAGGSGERAQFIINNPATSYTYTVGAAGTAGTAGSSGFAGGAGGTGYIVVDEYY